MSGSVRTTTRTERTLELGPGAGAVSALALAPERAEIALALAHGAGAGMRHPFMEALAERLAAGGVATFRYQFPYMEKRLSRTDPPSVATATVEQAVRAMGELWPYATAFAGGKSFGARMSSTAMSLGLLSGVKGLVFFGFPLHAPGRPSRDRADHLDRVEAPMLFLQGTRDTLCDIEQLGVVLERLGRRAALRLWDGADHSFHVPKRSGRTDEQVLDELAESSAQWMAGIASGGA
jgi:predicted alpha/beta-hydrolase family hydrolase